MTETFPVSYIDVRNKSGKRIMAEVSYSASTETITVTIMDRVGTLYIDANPNKSITISMKEIGDGISGVSQQG